MIKQGDKIKLKTGEIAFVSEVLEADVMYVVELLKKGGGASIEQIAHGEIESVFEEIERPLKRAI